MSHSTDLTCVWLLPSTREFLFCYCLRHHNIVSDRFFGAARLFRLPHSIATLYIKWIDNVDKVCTPYNVSLYWSDMMQACMVAKMVVMNKVGGIQVVTRTLPFVCELSFWGGLYKFYVATIGLGNVGHRDRFKDLLLAGGVMPASCRRKISMNMFVRVAHWWLVRLMTLLEVAFDSVWATSWRLPHACLPSSFVCLLDGKQ